MNSSNPLVSICIPTFNRGGSVWRAIESAINQTYKNIEVVVVDNASTDNTKEIVLEYTARDKRVKYFRNEKNIGSGRNFLKCAEYASGYFVQMLGDDDWLSRNYVEEGIKNFKENPEAAAIFSNVIALKVQADGKFTFMDQDLMKDGKYSADWFFRNFYRHPHVGSKGFIAFLRREDFIKSLRKELERPTSLLKRGELWEPIDSVVFFGILADYETFVITEKSAYIKTVAGDNVGLQGDFFKSQEGFVDYYFFLRRAYEGVFNDYKNLGKYIPPMRFSMGLNAIARPLSFFLGRKLSFGELKRYLQKVEKVFLKDYSVLETMLIGLFLPPRLFIGFLKRLGRIFSKKHIFSPNPNYFLTEDFKFKP